MKSRYLARLSTVVGALLLAIAVLAPVASAAEPRPGYEEFAGCPSPEENPAVLFCSVTVIDGGHFQMGSKDVPIKNPITLSGGIAFPSGDFVANENGGLEPVKQQVPGGIIGLTGLDWLVNFLNLEGLKLYAVTELAGTPGSPLETTLELPIKVHLINPVLGSNCYVGSTSNPIQLDLTAGTTDPPPPNEPISGTPPTQELDPVRPGVFLFNDGTFVDNAFAAPGADGCQLNLGLIHIGIDGLVNATSGLPSAAGTNETVQDFDAALAASEAVYP